MDIKKTLFATVSTLPPGNAITFGDLDSVIHIIARFLIGISLTLAVGFMVWAGITIMTALGNPTRFQSGLLRLRSAIIGIGVIMAVGVILNTIAAVIDRSFFCQVSLLGICLW